MNASDSVLFTLREKEKPYTSDQEDPNVVQPYGAFSPPGNVMVKTLSIIIAINTQITISYNTSDIFVHIFRVLIERQIL